VAVDPKSRYDTTLETMSRRQTIHVIRVVATLVTLATVVTVATVVMSTVAAIPPLAIVHRPHPDALHQQQLQSVPQRPLSLPLANHHSMIDRRVQTNL
jgi:hypothetical protein